MGVVERILSLTFCAMSGQMELRNEVRNDEFLQVNIFVLHFETIAEIDAPFTRDVVRDLDIANSTVPKKRGNDVIGVDISNIKINNQYREC